MFLVRNCEKKKMRPTEAQMEALLKFLERNPGITKGHLRTAMGKLETKRKWQELYNCLNSIGGAVKDGPGWAKFWTDKKYALKKLQSARNQSTNWTEGGREYLPQISPMEERMLALLGGSRFATGDREFSVPLIHEENMEHTEEEHPQQPLALDIQELEVLEFFGDTPQPTRAESTSTHLQPIRSPILPQPSNHTRPVARTNSRSVPQFRPLTGTGERARQRRERRRPYPSTSRSQLQVERDRLINIESKRVEAELLQAQNTVAIAAAINRLADILSTISQSIDRLINQ